MKRGYSMHVVPAILIAMFVLTGQLTAQTYVYVKISQSPVLTANAGPDYTIYPGESITLGGSPAAEGGAGSLNYEWHPPYHIESTTIANPVATPPGNVTYTLLVTDDRNCTATDKAIITVIGGTGINDRNSDGDLILYPNPSHGTIRLAIQGNRESDLKITVLTMTGQVVFNAIIPCTGLVPEAAIDLSSLPRGSYILHISGDFNDIHRNIILN